MKILTVCQGGTVRSVALARMLKDADVREKYDYPGEAHDVLAASWQWNSAGTLHGLCEWADLIVVMEPGHQEHLPHSYRSGRVLSNKVAVCDVGPDHFGHCFNEDLMKMCIVWIKGRGL